MNRADIMEVLPHRAPMLLVDRVLEFVDSTSLRACKTIPPDEPGYYVSLPGNAGCAGTPYPLALLIESWCQAAGIFATSQRPDPAVPPADVMLLTSVTHAQPHADVWPGDTVEHNVRLIRVLDDAMIFEGETRVADDRVVLTIERVVMTMRPAASLSQPKQTKESSGE